MHFNFVIPICLLVISFAFFHEVLCEKDKIVVMSKDSALRLSRRGKFSKRCGPTSPPDSGCQPLPNIVDPVNGAANGVTGYAPAQVYPAGPIDTNPLGLNTVTGSVLSAFPNLAGASTYPTAPQQQVVQAPQQQVAQAPQQQVAQTPQVAQAPQPVAQAPVYGSPIGTSPSPPPSTSTVDSKKEEKKNEDDDDDDDDDDDKKKGGSDNEDGDDANNEDGDDEE
ncbi:hypothetical protein BDF21DRAFT_494417 [Thamnidium elegans]|nr:hypothetical protein BDF21DRAFT_494417 [Thamnidium elegans]